MLFGGTGSGYYQDTWEWDGLIWAQRHPVVQPPARAWHAMAFDGARNVTVLFGGLGLSDTWEWNGSTWTDRSALYPRPLPRFEHAMTFDSVRQRVLMFGGDVGPYGLGNETWEWDGSIWTQKFPAHRPPAARTHSLAFDARRGVAVLYGGGLQDTWEWDGVDWQRSPATSPPYFVGCVLTYDTVRQRVVLFGGMFNDTWEWDGSSWTQRTPAHSPSSRRSHAMAFDPVRARIVLFGGAESPSGLPTSDTWEWDGNDWQERAPRTSPQGGGSRAAAVYDAARGRCVLLLAANYNSLPRYSSETWEWDGIAWTQRQPSHSPPPRVEHAMAYDARRGRVVVFGGGIYSRLDDTWEWDGTDWTEVQPAVRPPARTNHAMAYDAVRGRTVLFGGFGGSPQALLADTWEWDGSSWLRMTSPVSPSARNYHAMAGDDHRGRCVLFGGGADTWEWDGSSWLLRAPASSPSGRMATAMAYDALRRRTVLFGGWSPSMSDTWEWDGTTWLQRVTPVSATPRSSHVLAFDLARGRIVLFGGHDGLSDTWEYGPLTPGEFTPFGAGCAGSAGTPLLGTPGQIPYLGRPFRIELLQLPAASPALLWLGASRSSFGPIPLPLDLTPIGMTGCALRVSADLGFALLASNGVAALDLVVPADPSLAGAAVFTQGFVLDLFANPFGATSSNAGALRIGSP